MTPGKGQIIRALDVVAIGPLIIVGGLSLPKKRGLLASVLVSIGIGTILYNGANFLRDFESGE